MLIHVIISAKPCEEKGSQQFIFLWNDGSASIFIEFKYGFYLPIYLLIEISCFFCINKSLSFLHMYQSGVAKIWLYLMRCDRQCVCYESHFWHNVIIFCHCVFMFAPLFSRKRPSVGVSPHFNPVVTTTVNYAQVQMSSILSICTCAWMPVLPALVARYSVACIMLSFSWNILMRIKYITMS